ncbi:hypothetical protein TrVE_jg11742 [Triparma verrucosa]|uniref:Uncharacterized protein n=1 Tax=Triparma verrucosa TaxID=1606542 RepID=A0A9W7CH06_9STRA|nr:hypothetical protein TrVE_jg11742 [Triparma verrucosa]
MEQAQPPQPYSQLTESLIGTVGSVVKLCGLHVPPFKKENYVYDSGIQRFATNNEATIRSLYEMFSTNNSPQGQQRRKHLSYSQFFRAIVACDLARVGCDLGSNFCLVRIFLASLDDPSLIERDEEEKKEDNINSASSKKPENSRKKSSHNILPEEAPALNLESKLETLKKSYNALVDYDSEVPLHENPALIRQLLTSVEDNPLPGQFSLLVKLLGVEAGTNGWAAGGNVNRKHRNTKVKKAFVQETSGKFFLGAWRSVTTMAHSTLHRNLGYAGWLNAFLATLYIANYRQKGGDSVVSVLEKAMAGVSRNIAALTKNSFLHNVQKASESTLDEFTPSEELQRLTSANHAILTKIFHAYCRIFGTAPVLTRDGLTVFLLDTSLYKNLPLSSIEVLLSENQLDMEDGIEEDTFLEINDCLLKSNWDAVGQRVVKYIDGKDGMKEEVQFWNSAQAEEETRNSLNRLTTMFEVYEMPIRLSSFGPSITRNLTIGEAGFDDRIVEIGVNVVDFWTGQVVNREEDPFKEDAAFRFTGGGANLMEIKSRKKLLSLIVDKTQAPEAGAEAEAEENSAEVDKEVRDEEGGQDDASSKSTPTKNSPAVKQHSFKGKEDLVRANLGKSILDMAFKLTSKKEESNQPELDTQTNNRLPTVPSPIPDRSEVQDSPDTTNQDLTSVYSHASPTPPPHLGGGINKSKGGRKHRKVFKKQFGLARGIQPFRPRMSMQSTERKRTARRMREAEAVILSQSAKMTLTNPVDQKDSTFLTNQDQSFVSYNHPSYRLFDEAMKIKPTNPERAIAMCEKALAFAQNMDNGVEHKLTIYEELVTMCLMMKHWQHAGDLMEAHLELIRNERVDRKDEVRVLNQLGKVQFVMQNYEEAETCHAQQQSLAHQIYDHLGEMKAFYGQGVALHAMGHLEDACAMFKRYLDTADECSENKEISIACGRMGAVLMELGKVEDSFVAFKRQIVKLRDVLHESPGDKAAVNSLAQAFGNLGKVYRMWGKLPLARNALQKQLKLATDLNSVKIKASSMHELASTSIELKLGIKLDSVLKYFGDGMSDSVWDDYLWEKSGLEAHAQFVRRMNGWGDGELQVLNEARSYFEQVLNTVDESDLGLQFKAKFDAGSIHFIRGDCSTASEYYNAALETLTKIAKKAELSAKYDESLFDPSSNEEDDEDLVELEDEAVKWAEASYELRMKRIKLFLLSGCYQILHQNYSGAASSLLRLVEGDNMCKASDTMEYLACGTMMLGFTRLMLGQKDEAIKYYEQGAKFYIILRDGVGRASALMGLAKLKEGVDTSSMLFELLGACFEIGRDEEIPHLQVVSLERLADLHSEIRDTSTATELAKRAMKIRQAMGQVGGVGKAQASLAKKVEEGLRETSAVWSEL